MTIWDFLNNHFIWLNFWLIIITTLIVGGIDAYFSYKNKKDEES